MSNKNDLRPVSYEFKNGGEVYTMEGYFHEFSVKNGEPVAIVERRSGTIIIVPADKITFTDR
jgi:hypothetical protein